MTCQDALGSLLSWCGGGWLAGACIVGLLLGYWLAMRVVYSEVRATLRFQRKNLEDLNAVLDAALEDKASHGK